MNRIAICAAAAIATLAAPALAGTKITQLSASIILVGEPAPAVEAAAVEAAPAKQVSYRRGTPDVLAAGERRAGGIPLPVRKKQAAPDEKPSATEAPANASGEAGAETGAPGDGELRLGE